jgi:hypothetical protein
MEDITVLALASLTANTLMMQLAAAPNKNERKEKMSDKNVVNGDVSCLTRLFKSCNETILEFREIYPLPCSVKNSSGCFG